MIGSAEQRRVFLGMAAAAVATAAAFAFGPALVWPMLPAISGAGDRIAFALRVDLFLAVPLALSIADIARRRFLSPDDIAGSAFGAPTAPVAAARAVLQNTAEQTQLALIVHLALAAIVPAERLALLPVLTALFCAGRLFFALGYAHGAAARSFGFALTFYPTLAALVWGLACLVG